jgi:hypothetical protein
VIIIPQEHQNKYLPFLVNISESNSTKVDIQSYSHRLFSHIQTIGKFQIDIRSHSKRFGQCLFSKTLKVSIIKKKYVTTYCSNSSQFPLILNPFWCGLKSKNASTRTNKNTRFLSCTYILLTI